MWEGLLVVSSPRQQHNKSPLEGKKDKMADGISLAVCLLQGILAKQ